MEPEPRQPPDRSASLPAYANDPPSNQVPSPSSTIDPNRRKMTIMALLSELTELRDEEGLANSPTRDYGDKKVKLESMDDRFQVQGVEMFKHFESLVKALDKELQSFVNAARQLGSSMGLLSSAAQMRQRLMHLLALFHENAAELFPRHVKKSNTENVSRFGSVTNLRPSKLVARLSAEDMSPEALPTQLRELSRDLTSFLHCLNEFPEFTDEGVNTSMLAFAGDLQYWGSTLNDFRDQFRVKAVERYVHDLTTEMSEHLESITAALKVFVEVGVPTIRFAQQQASNNLLNLSTIGAFFSGVTTTTLQYSFDKIDNNVEVAVNLFFFASLVLSIAATVNSLLGLTWKHAMYRSPRQHVPWWVSIWTKRSPLIFLVLAVAAFSAGLVMFAFASQPYVTAMVTLVLTSFSSVGLVAVSFWIAAERWTFAKHNGKRWLGQVLSDMAERFLHMTGIRWICTVTPVFFSRLYRGFMRQVEAFNAWLWASTKRLTSRAQPRREAVLPVARPATLPRSTPPSVLLQLSRTAEAQRPTLAKIVTAVATSSTAVPVTPTPMPGGIEESPRRVSSDTKRRFQAAVMRAARAAKAAGAMPRKATLPDSSEPFLLKPTRIGGLVQDVRAVRQEYVLDEHIALVRHLQFSPNGKYLATCSWDRTTRIWQLPTSPEDPFQTRHTLPHPSGFVGQVAWSPDSTLLLTRLVRSIKIWTEDGDCTRSIERPYSITSVTWLPDGKGFLSVEGSTIFSLDLSGKVVGSYLLQRLDIQEVAVTPDGTRLFAVANLIQSADGLKPVRSRHEKRIISYNMEKRVIDAQVPVLHDVRGISLSRNGHLALVSYGGQAPPQLWRVKDRLSLIQTYMPKGNVEFAGLSYLAGPPSRQGDELVICPSKCGEILIWDRETGALIHTIRADPSTNRAESGANLTGIAWNPASSRFMIASASHDGSVVIWCSPTSSIASGQDGLLGLNRGKERSRGPTYFGGGLEQFDRRTESRGRFFFGDPGQGTSDGHVMSLTSSPNETQMDLRDDGVQSEFGFTTINGEPEDYEGVDERELGRFVETSTAGEFRAISPIEPPLVQEAPAADGKRTIYFAH